MENYNFEERQKEKQKSRNEDQRRLDSGEISRDDLRKENGIFANLNAKPNFIEFLQK